MHGDSSRVDLNVGDRARAVHRRQPKLPARPLSLVIDGFAYSLRTGHINLNPLTGSGSSGRWLPVSSSGSAIGDA